MARDRYVAGLRSALDRAGVPYGYTVTIWTSGQVLIGERGVPSMWLLPAFPAGAALAYAVLLLLTRRPADASDAAGVETRGVLAAAAAQVAAIGLAIGGVAIIGEAPAGIAWPSAGFVATALYLAGTATAFAIPAP